MKGAHRSEDHLDGLTAESRKKDEKIPLEEVIENLKKGWNPEFVKKIEDSLKQKKEGKVTMLDPKDL